MAYGRLGQAEQIFEVTAADAVIARTAIGPRREQELQDLESGRVGQRLQAFDQQFRHLGSVVGREQTGGVAGFVRAPLLAMRSRLSVLTARGHDALYILTLVDVLCILWAD